MSGDTTRGKIFRACWTFGGTANGISSYTAATRRTNASGSPSEEMGLKSGAKHFMRILGEYRGVMFSIPRNDDGIWHYAIHPKRDRRTTICGMPPGSGPEGLPSRQEAITAAKHAIDHWLDGAAEKIEHGPSQQSAASDDGDGFTNAQLDAPVLA